MIPTAVCYGEVLWDIFPTHKKIGGAPLNVALRLNAFKINTHIISRVGKGNNGKELLHYIEENGMKTSYVQVDQSYKTGCVYVTLDTKGSATYEIEYPVAWDKIELTDQMLELVKSSDAFIFGSLVCRDETSKNTLFNLLAAASFKVFDVNLRNPFYSIDLLIDLMDKADFVKCNDDELHEICKALNFNSKSIGKQVKFLAKQTQTNKICVTKGKDGAILLYDDQYYSNSGYPIKVADTVGAGDSFLATLINNLLNKVKPERALDLACAVGAMVAGKKGANPKIAQLEILDFIRSSDRNS